MKENKKFIIAGVIVVAVVVIVAAIFLINMKKKVDYTSLALNSSKWQYDTVNNVYYQIGVSYCLNPEAPEYENLSVYVPGEYMAAVDNGDGTFTCSINGDGKVKGFDSSNAPIVIPVKTPGYTGLKAETEYNYENAAKYLDAGFIYVHAGCRGTANGYDDAGNLIYSAGAPWGVTDLKAAVRYLRYNESAMPGDAESIFTFGMSGGGAQSSLMGATGDSKLYSPYLESIGAIMNDDKGHDISDAVAGAMCWCPITTLDIADAAYEWNMGQYSKSDTRADGTWTSALSDDLSLSFADYINSLGITDSEGNELKLEESDAGIYAAGSYYNYLMDVVNESLNNYLKDNGITRADEINTYLGTLNTEEVWVVYDEASKKATVTSMEALAKYWKLPNKPVAAFDDLLNNKPENNLFGNDENEKGHFDSVLAELLKENVDEYSKLTGWDASLVESYSTGVASLDKLGGTIETRLNMYNPMYYLLESSDGYEKSTVAKYWRIRTGLQQMDTALTTEVNLALALEKYEGVELDFATIWDKAHVEAESTGDFTDKFIEWVNECLEK